jgi:hypothetical protein
MLLRVPFPEAPAVAFTPAVLFAGGASGTGGFWYDPSDISTLWADQGRTAPATVDGAVSVIDDKSGNARHLMATGTAPRLRVSGGQMYLDILDGTTALRRVGSFPNDAMDAHYALRAASGDRWVPYWDFQNGSANAFYDVVQSGSASSPESNAGTATHFVDGVSVSATRGALFTAIGTGADRVSEARGVMLGTWSAFQLFSYGAGFGFVGRFYGAVQPSVTAADVGSRRADLLKWLAAKQGRTL